MEFLLFLKVLMAKASWGVGGGGGSWNVSYGRKSLQKDCGTLTCRASE